MLFCIFKTFDDYTFSGLFLKICLSLTFKKKIEEVSNLKYKTFYEFLEIFLLFLHISLINFINLY